MSSPPSRIVIQPKKRKKKKGLVIVSKTAGGANAKDKPPPHASRPASPDTVLVGDGAGPPPARPSGQRGGGRGGGGKRITIAPYAVPPSLPPDFYDGTLATLRRAMDCVLRREAVVAGGGGGRRLVGREELYRSVEDLVRAGHGRRLYGDVVSIVDGAASEAVRRLASGDGGGGGMRAEIVDGNVVYDSSRLVGELRLCAAPGGGGGDAGDAAGEARVSLLRRLRSVCRASYAEEYLSFVRSTFLALDRACVFRSEAELGDVVGGGDGPDGADGAPDGITDWGGGCPLAGTVADRSSAPAGSRTFGLGGVGTACLRRHMTPSGGEGHVSVLTALVATTARVILSEFDGDDSEDCHLTRPGTTTSPADAGGDVRPLVRDCVRTVVDLGALPVLLEEVVVSSSAAFADESRRWADDLAGGRRTSPQFLRFVERRLRRAGNVASYYLPSGGGATVDALRVLSSRGRLSGCLPPDSYPPADRGSDAVVWRACDSSPRRMFPAVVESRLLAPHVASDGILGPRHLHPVLDGGGRAGSSPPGRDGGSFDDAARLYGLCRRLAASDRMEARSSAVPGDGDGAAGADPPGETALDLLRRAFGDYGRLRGSEVVSPPSSSSGPGASAPSGPGARDAERRVVPDLLSFRSHLRRVHAEAFRSDDAFASTVRSVLDDVVNGNVPGSDDDGGRRTAELLAKHIDARFKDARAAVTSSSSAGPGGLVDAAIAGDAAESFQAEVMCLFRHVNSKDVFEAFYKRDLAKRLLTGRSVSYDMERSFLSKLKAECGAGYTSKMEGMFKDMDLSREIITNYAAYASRPEPPAGSSGDSPSPKPVEFDVQVLTTGYWPAYPKYPNIVLPPGIVSVRSRFERYYDSKYQGRRIAWQYSLGNCVVKATFPRCAAPKELLVNLPQSLVLLCFQNDDGEDGAGLTIDEISKRTGIDDRGELTRVLQSLSMGREGTRVLRKIDHVQEATADSGKPAPPSDSPRKKQKVRRTVGPLDRFRFNASFTSNQRRIRITNITMKETTEERKKTHDSVSKDRLYFIDAAVVRIMKARKTVDHRDLMGEVLAQLKFPASSSDIKKRIESLIEREYMERVDGVSRYKYLA